MTEFNSLIRMPVASARAWFAARRRTIVGADGTPYLTRVTLVDFGKDVGRVYLHKFHRGDEDEEFHSHPWWAISLILWRGYREERWVDGRVVVREYRPFSVNRIETTTFHRVDLLGPSAWTILLTGPVQSSWGFLNVVTKEFLPWRTFLVKKVARRGTTS